MSESINRKPKVAIVYHFFAHYRTAVMRELMHGSDEFEFVLIGDTSDPNGSGVESIDFGESDNFQHIRSWTFTPARFLIQPKVLSIACRRDLDAIIFLGNSKFLTTWLAIILARLCGKHVLYWTHGWNSPESGVRLFWRKLFYGLADHVLLYGQRAKAFAIDYGLDDQHLHVVFNSLDYDRQRALRESITDSELRELRAELFENPTWPVILHVGRLIARKRLDLMIDVAAQLKDQGHPVNVLFVGDGPEAQKLKGLGEEKQIPVNVYGACYEEEKLARLLMASNVCIAPENLGLTAMHAMAYGTPVITSDLPQAPEWEAIIPGKNGDRYEYGSIDSLTEKTKIWTQSELVDTPLRYQVAAVIEQFYNAKYQRETIERALRRQPPVPLGDLEQLVYEK